MTKLGNALRHARTSQNLTLREAANKMGISPAYLSEIETGKKAPDNNEKITLFAKFYGLDEPDLMFMAKLSTPFDEEDTAISDEMFRVARRIMDGKLSSDQVLKIRKIIGGED